MWLKFKIIFHDVVFDRFLRHFAFLIPSLVDNLPHELHMRIEIILNPMTGQCTCEAGLRSIVNAGDHFAGDELEIA